MKKLLILALSFVFAFALLDEKGQQVYNNIAESDEMGNYTQNIPDPFVATSSLVLSTKDYKSQYLVGELFTIELTAKTDEKTDFEFELEFNKNDSLLFLNPNVKWLKNGNEYTTTLWFEAKDVNAALIQILVNLKRNKEIFQQASLNINPLQFKRIDAGKNYAHIVAKELNVKRVKSDYFDDKNLVMVVEFEAQEANLKNFHLNNEKIIQQRVDGFRGDFNTSSAFYSAVFAPSVSELNFSYFNTSTQSLQNISLKVELSNEKLSTQSDLNPKNNDLLFYKRLALWALSGVLVLIFVFKRHYFFFALAVIIFVGSFFIGSKDTQTAILKANSRAKILPTSQSTYFYTSEKDEEVEILGKRKEWVKILLSNGKIGWVSNENLQKN